MAASPGGAFLWAVWNQWKETEDGHVYKSDPVLRRLVGTPIDFSGRFNAPGTLDVTGTLWSWGDGSAPETGAMPIDLQGQGASWVTGTHAFAAAGVYPVMLSVTDAEGRVGYDYEYFPVYEPQAGRITGEGGFSADGHLFASWSGLPTRR